MEIARATPGSPAAKSWPFSAAGAWKDETRVNTHPNDQDAPVLELLGALPLA
jgi:hypothetical protein